MLKLTNVFPIFVIAIILFMFGCEQVNSPNHDSGTDIATADGSIAEAHAGSGIVYVDANNNSGNEDGTQVNPFDTVQEGVDHASSGETVKLMSDFILSNEVVISNPLSLDGNGNTVFSSFTLSGSNNSAIEIFGTSDVTVSNLNIDGSGGTDLHGINVYESKGVLVSDVSISANRTGLVVNGSEVTAHNISTSGHGWHGINVDQGVNVTDPGILTVTGISTHDENSPLPPSDFIDGTHVADIFVDDNNRNVTVNDVNDQYLFASVDFRGGTADVYTHYLPETKDDCKKGGWEDYGFKNQGQCIQFVNTGKK